MKIPKRLKFFYVLFFSIICIGLTYTACKKTEKSSDTQESESVSVTSDLSYDDGSSNNSDDADLTPYKFERTQVLNKIAPIEEKPLSLPFSTTAHSKYLGDAVAFKNLPDGGVPSGNTAVVGSDLCLFYPVTSISLMEDLGKLPKGENIPFATIIQLGDKFVCKNSEYNDLYKLEDNYNYFYKTTWQGKQGIVFGSDLYGIGTSNEDNRMNALLYKDNGYFNAFYPVTGYDAIKTDIQKELETNGLAFQEVKQSEYQLSVEKPDDMISLYMERGMFTPVFITTDLAAHANHLVFDKLLQYCEEEIFFPQLVTVINKYIEIIKQKKGQIPDAVYNTSMLYFQTAQALLALAPQKMVKNDYGKTIVYKDVDAAKVLSNYPQQVVNDIAQMNNASGFGQSAVFPGVKEDYSQYKVRGHYTKNGVLGAYFRALMWFGRINFNLGGDTGDAKEAAKKLAPVALFITDITENSPEIKKLWQSLFDPITEIIGASDDISFYELAPLWNKIKGANFMQWYNDSAKLETFISKDYKELHAPAISGSSLFKGVYDGGSAPEDRLAPIGWRLFGQRYTMDSEIHHFASPPRLIGRNMVSGLDIMKVFGSKTADQLLRSDYSKYDGLEKTLNSLQQNMTNLKDDYWFSTYYTNILYQVRTLALFENGAGFYFTEKPGWNLKAMNSAHGTWAELRHDTILYAKQSYAENAGGGDWEPTFRTKPLPEPVHYIEPNVPFWITSAIGIQKLYKILEKYDFLDGEAAQVLASLHSLFVKAAEISRLEADDQDVPAVDLAWIETIPGNLSRLVIALSGGSGYIENTDSLRMALVADVFTNAESMLVLETAVGIPYRLYIPLNDKQGGKRIAIGYGFSYYEFTQSMSNRLNNDQWKAVVYGANPDMKKYLPSWMQGKVKPAK
ncbi:DUF3160 domain-containing protein [Treponema sp. R80B11-R83G3]